MLHRQVRAGKLVAIVGKVTASVATAAGRGARRRITPTPPSRPQLTQRNKQERCRTADRRRVTVLKACRERSIDPRMADLYEPPRIEERTDIGPGLVGYGGGLPSGVAPSAAFRPL
jgi:hypothetical protein